MTGTFIIRPTVQDSGGTPQYNSNGPFPNDAAGWFTEDYPVTPLLDVIALPTPIPNSLQIDCFGDAVPNSYDNTLRLSFSGASIYLDGSLIPITFAGLPSGFTPLSASVEISTAGVAQPAVGFTKYFLQQGPITEGILNTSSFPYDFTIPPSMLDIISSGIGLRVSFSVGAIDSGGINQVCDFHIEGTYEIQSYTYTVSPSPVQIGEDVTITSPDGGVPFILTDDGNGNSGIQIDSSAGTFIIPTTAIIFIDATTLIFTLPVDFPVEETVEVFIIGTTFSGRVSAGNLDILLYGNVSGIYTLVPGKETDTIYRHDGTSTEVKIPNPFAKIGFIGS